MDVETFRKHFATFADAPNGVAKLREMILQLAVQGKLVPQNPADEPAHNLLKRIATERMPPSDQRRSRASIESNGAARDEKPYKLPPAWQWARFDEVATIASKLVHPKLFPDVPHIAPDNIEKGTGRLLPFRTVVEDGVRSGNHQFFAGQIVYSKIRPNLAKVTLVDFDGLCSADMYPINSHIDPRYLVRFMLSRTFLRMAVRTDTRVAMPKINQEELSQILVAVPPLAEQRRIVAKVDELLRLCDELEARQRERQTARQKLVRATLDRLATARTPAESKPRAARLRHHFDLLFDTPTTIPQLREAILQLAVGGRLVRQDLNDESARDLLCRIAIDRERIANDQGIRPPKNVPEVRAEACPFDIPPSWQWARIGALALLLDYGTSEKAGSDPTKVPVYRMGNIVFGRLIDDNLKYVDPTIDDLPSLYLQTDDILFNRTNSYELVGKTAIFRDGNDTATFASYLIRLRLPSSHLFPSYFNLAMNAPFFRQTQINPEIIQQCGQANFNGTKLASTVVPVPPLAEQRRIVAKVNELMSLCDTLEASLTDAESASAKLLSAAVAKMLSVLQQHP